MESQNQTISKAMLEQIQIEKDFQSNESLCESIQNQNQIQDQIPYSMDTYLNENQQENQDQEQDINSIEEEDYESDKSEQYEIDSDYCSNSSQSTQIKLNWDEQMKINSRNFENLLEVCVRDMEPESTFNDASYSKYMESLSNDDTETIQMDQQNLKEIDNYSEYGNNNLKHQKIKKAVSVFSQQQQEQVQKQTTDEKIIFKRISKDLISPVQKGTLKRTYLFKLSQFDQKKFKGIEIKNQGGKKDKKFRLQLEEERIDQTGVNSNIIKRQVNLKKEKKLQVSRITLNAKDLILIFKEMKQNLQEIKINNCEIVCQDIQERKELLRQINNLKKLKIINLQGIKWMCKQNQKQINQKIKLEGQISQAKIKKLELKQLPKLQKLDLSGCQQFPEMIGDGFDNFTELNLSFSKIKKLELRSLPKLQKLDLSGCIQLQELNLNGFNNLAQLNLNYTKIKKLELKSLPKLQELKLYESKQLSELILYGFVNLTLLDLRRTQIKNLELNYLPKLQKLNLSQSKQLYELNLNGLYNLKQLNLSNTKIRNLELKYLPKLQKLNLSRSKQLHELSLNGLYNLKYLNLSYTQIKKLKLKYLPKLQILNLSQSKKLHELYLNGLYNLKQLNLSKTKIRNLELKQLPKLRKFNFYKCKQLLEISLGEFDDWRKLILFYSKKKKITLKQLKQLIKRKTQQQKENEYRSFTIFQQNQKDLYQIYKGYFSQQSSRNTLHQLMPEIALCCLTPIFQLLNNYDFIEFQKGLFHHQKDLFILVVCQVYKFNFINQESFSYLTQQNKKIIQKQVKELQSRLYLDNMIKQNPQLQYFIAYLQDKQSLNKQREQFKNIIIEIFSQVINFQAIIKFSQILYKQRKNKLISQTQIFNKMAKFLLLLMQLNYSITPLISLDLSSQYKQEILQQRPFIIQLLLFKASQKTSQQINSFLKYWITKCKNFNERATQIKNSLLGYNMILKLGQKIQDYKQKDLKFWSFWQDIVND